MLSEDKKGNVTSRVSAHHLTGRPMTSPPVEMDTSLIVRQPAIDPLQNIHVVIRITTTSLISISKATNTYQTPS